MPAPMMMIRMGIDGYGPVRDDDLRSLKKELVFFFYSTWMVTAHIKGTPQQVTPVADRAEDA